MIPSYNRKAWLLECLDSIYHQTYEPYEIIVVDDGSTDGTLDVLRTDHPRVLALHQKNAGPGAARNRGARQATGDYLAFIDSDDVWLPWTLNVFSDLIELHNGPSLIFGRFLDFIEPVDLEKIELRDVDSIFFSDFLASHSESCFCGAGMMVIRRTSFEKTTGFAEDFLNAEDHDLALQLGTAPGFVQVLSPITIGHRVHCMNEMSDINKTLRGMQRVISKEIAGEYPGGAKRRDPRQEIISRHARAAVASAIRSGHVRQALQLYKATASWNLRLGRFRYLAAVPLIALKHLPKML